MAETTIEWATHTWNPIRGCTRFSPGCLNCYAERMAARGLPGLNSPTTGEPFAVMTPSGPRWTGKVELIESKLMEPLRWRKPRIIFVNSISDTFHESVPDSWIERIFAVMEACPQHYFLVLTKRAERMRGWFRGIEDWPLPNVGLGVSAEDQQRADERIPHLLVTPAAMRFVSVEPLLGPVNLNRVEYEPEGSGGTCFLDVMRGWGCSAGGSWSTGKLDWVIIGGESGPGARPCAVEWVDSLVRQCSDAGVACFVKQLGAEIHGDYEDFPTARHIPGEGHKTWRLNDHKGGDPSEWPELLRVRQYPAQMGKWKEARHG